MSQQQDLPIVVSGGSVTLEYDPNQLPPNGNGKRYNASKKIYNVTVVRNGVTLLDQDIPDGRVTVTIRYRDGGSNNP